MKNLWHVWILINSNVYQRKMPQHESMTRLPHRVRHFSTMLSSHTADI